MGTKVIEIDSGRFLCDVAAEAAPAVEVPPGSTLRVHCRNAGDRQIGPGPAKAPSANPATGPIAVTGAAPGQALRLDVVDIACESPGWLSAGWNGGQQPVEIAGGRALFRGIPVPLAPMIGVLGVAPRQGSWSTMACGPFGGNMDTNDVAPGAAVYLPVFQPGGRFVLGDIHAVMGDGEIGGQGLEVAGTVTLRAGVEPAPLTDHVYLVRNDRLMVIGCAETIEEAVRDAAVAMMKLLARAGVMDEFSAMKFLGLAGDTLFGQHCCRTKSVRVSLPLEYVPRLRGGKR